MSRRPPVHAFVEMLGAVTGYAVIDPCQKCGMSRGASVHAVPPPAKKPQLRHFNIGDHVVILPDAYQADIRGHTGTVVEEDLTAGQQVSVLIELDEPPAVKGKPQTAIYQAWVGITHVRKMVAPPQFSSVEEAEAWMAMQGE